MHPYNITLACDFNLTITGNPVVLSNEPFNIHGSQATVSTPGREDKVTL